MSRKQTSIVLSKREKNIFCLMAAVILAIFGYNFIVEPQAGKLNELNKKIMAREAELEKKNRIISRKDSITRQYNSYISYIKQAGSDEEEEAFFFQEVENSAKDSRVYIADIKPAGLKESEYYKKYTVEVKVETDMNSLIKFIYGLQSSPNLIRIDGLRLSAKNASGRILRGSLQISKILLLPLE